MKISIENLICPACICFVHWELERLGINYKSTGPGEFEITNIISEEELKQLEKELHGYKLKVIYEDRYQLVSKVKVAIKDFIYNQETQLKMRLPEYISHLLTQSYPHINRIFMEETGVSIERYFNSKRLKYAIELLIHYNLTPIEIVYQLNFNSIEHFTKQFEVMTGLTPSTFKQEIFSYEGVNPS
jgi:AraC-like DNA-binding protein